MKQPHKTIKNFCCACEFDQAVFENKLELAKQKQRDIIIDILKDTLVDIHMAKESDIAYLDLAEERIKKRLDKIKI